MSLVVEAKGRSGSGGSYWGGGGVGGGGGLFAGDVVVVVVRLVLRGLMTGSGIRRFLGLEGGSGGGRRSCGAESGGCRCGCR